MLALMDILMNAIELIFAALIAYDQTPEGEAAINAFLASVEADGIDIPFWSPSGDEGEPLDLSSADIASGVAGAVRSMADRFAQRHPELVKQEGKDNAS